MTQSPDKAEEPIRPQGNVDLARCKNGNIRIVGWMFWSETDPRPAKISLRSMNGGRKRVPLSMFPDSRPDVNEYLAIDPAIETGFSGNQSLNTIAMSDLPHGLAEIVATDPKGEFENRVIGMVDVKWPEAPFRVAEPDAADPGAETSLPAESKPRGFFSRLWNGVVGGDEELLQLLDMDVYSAKNIMLALRKIEGDGEFESGHVNDGLLGLALRLRNASTNDGLIVILDHKYGGGANTFSEQLSAKHTSTGNGVLHFWYSVGEGTFGAQFKTQTEATDIHIESLNTLFRLLTVLPSFAIQLNSIWTYPDTYLLLDNLLRLRLYGYTKRLEIFAHDHMAVCPSLFLLNHKNVFCGVPEDLKTCKTCLSRNRLDFKSYYPQTDIEAWRASWQSLLVNSDLIRFFSNSTLANYTDAYPWLADSPNVVVEGHEVKDLWPRGYNRERALANKVADEGLKIAVFGFISEHKGSGVLKAMSDAILKQHDSTRILVFGSLEGQTFGRYGVIDVMGPYAPVDILDLCEDNGVDIAFVPSICPESFSYITKELTLVGVPVASFGFGGQGDMVEAYQHGHIVKRGTGLQLLRQFKAIEKVEVLRTETLSADTESTVDTDVTS